MGWTWYETGGTSRSAANAEMTHRAVCRLHRMWYEITCHHHLWQHVHDMELVNGLVTHENTQPLMHLLTTLIDVELQGNAQLSYVTAKLTEHSWADRLQLRGQCTNEEYSSANVAAGMTTFIWTIRVQPSWLVAADLTAELTSCNWAFRWQLSWAYILQRSVHFRAQLMFCSWSVTADELHDRIR